jgi:RimJ/RimL family protein N-acetyltransferase
LIPCEVDLAKGVLAVSLAHPSDAQSLIDHARGVAGESDFLKAGPGERRLTPALQAAFLHRLRTHDLGFVLKGERRGRLIAVLTIVRPQHPRLHHRAELGLTVRSAHWGQGAGRRLAELGIRLAQAQGIRKLNLSVRADNLRALRLYRSLGFQEEGISARALRVGHRFFSEVSMGLCIDFDGNPGRVPKPSREATRPAKLADSARGKTPSGRRERAVKQP